MEHRLVPGVEADYAGQRWRVSRILGPDVVLLTNDAGETVAAEPARIALPAEVSFAAPQLYPDERLYTDAQWTEAARRRDLLVELAQRPSRTLAHVDDAARGTRP